MVDKNTDQSIIDKSMRSVFSKYKISSNLFLINNYNFFYSRKHSI